MEYAIVDHSVTKVEGSSIYIQINFKDPIEISADETLPDRLMVSIEFKYLFVTEEQRLMKMGYHNDTKNVP